MYLFVVTVTLVCISFTFKFNLALSYILLCDVSESGRFDIQLEITDTAP